MQRPALLALALTSLLSGCAARTTTFGAGTSGHAPPLPAGAQVPMWDHYCAGIEAGRGVLKVASQILTEASASGWELVTFTSDGIFCFKRPRPGVTAAPGATYQAPPIDEPAATDAP